MYKLISIHFFSVFLFGQVDAIIKEASSKTGVSEKIIKSVVQKKGYSDQDIINQAKKRGYDPTQKEKKEVDKNYLDSEQGKTLKSKIEETDNVGFEKEEIIANEKIVKDHIEHNSLSMMYFGYDIFKSDPNLFTKSTYGKDIGLV